MILGVFGNVVTSGNIINDPALGDTTFANNAGTAVFAISNSSDTTLGGTPALQTTGSALIWGIDAAVPPTEQFSELDFFGAQAPADIHAPFEVGRITYLNGTSDLNSLIFGASLSFYVNRVSPATFLGTDTVFINTTENTSGTLDGDADWINICGNGSNICDSRLEAFEDTEGGTGVTADLMGNIVGDPRLILDSISLTPGQNPLASGFIGSGHTLSVPEPSSWALALIGFGLCVLVRLGATLPFPGRRSRTAAL